MKIVSGTIVDPLARRVFPGRIGIEAGHIAYLHEDSQAIGPFILPGLVDSHVHIESSLLTPAAFAAQAVVHGTVAVVADPHEITNVLGIPGLEMMIASGRQAPLKFAFGAPSCVPATPFETAGAAITAADIDYLLGRDDIYFLAEMMNFPGVLAKDPEVMAKLAAARKHGKVVDGHAPGLGKVELQQYIQAGISTDHESCNLAECLEKLQGGMHILLRQGSSARNFSDLHSLISSHPGQCMLCTDDLKPVDLLAGHINTMVSQAVALGHDLFDVLQCSSVNPVRHYQLAMGLLQVGDPADFIMVNDLSELTVQACYIDGEQVSGAGKAMFRPAPAEVRNNFQPAPLAESDLSLVASSTMVRVIEVTDGQLSTGHGTATLEPTAQADPGQDILKVVVQNRYQSRPPALAFVRGFGLQRGAMASSIGHDSHNIIAVGCSDLEISRAIALLHGSGGGLAFYSSTDQDLLPLPIAGIMATESCAELSQAYLRLEQLATEHGCTLQTPFMTMAFLALPVIPSLRITDQGLFDVDNFCFTQLFC